ncbi:alpha/beta fold hydrolase [Simiduia agarivorans]|uniref:Alpha/beta hydrolase fold protein n=1 Tax=Simiduia agarivorans (strain DSM 21679 / JCM 13881 / BCRC 17597 / SA1) TaxID=1117647 RepID=K4KMZ9_SIMAS|nr:alpha/beta hydrolase [Simiduia agarivorans]AFV00550.2 alpha/beta hydrolase fold protein [Simiduia agarivorans SA1 = DSM 21679]
MPQRVYAIPGTQCDERLWNPLTSHLPELEWIHLPISTADGMDRLVQDLLQQLPPEPVALLGFSLGAYLAAGMACAAPARIERLFLCSNTPCALPDEELQQREQLLQWVRRNGYQGISDRKIRTMLSPINHHRMDVFATIKAMDANLGAASLVQQLSATSRRQDLLTPLSQLAIPIHFCAGRDDALVSVSWLSAWEALGKLPCCWVEKAGHMLPLEAPEALSGAIRRWLDCSPENVSLTD